MNFQGWVENLLKIPAPKYCVNINIITDKDQEISMSLQAFLSFEK